MDTRREEKLTALITGSTGGFGRCLAQLHAQRGGDLILVGRSAERLDAQKSELEEAYGVRVQTITADLVRSDAAQHIYDTCRANGWQVDVLINNAGFGGQGDFTRDRTMEQDLSMLAVNVEAPTRLCKLFLPDFVERGAGAQRVLHSGDHARPAAGLLLRDQGVCHQLVQCPLAGAARHRRDRHLPDARRDGDGLCQSGRPG